MNTPFTNVPPYPVTAIPPKQMTIKEAIDKLVMLENSGNLDEADKWATYLLTKAPNHPHLLHVAGIIFYKKNKLDLAIELTEKAEKLDGSNPIYPRNMCEIYRVAGRLDDALRVAKRAVVLQTNRDSLFMLSMIHFERLELRESLQVADQCLALDPNFPEINFSKAEVLLLLGYYEEGWQYYEWRFKLEQAKGTMPLFSAPVWNGKPLPEGRLTIVCDQGYGDCIQFARFISQIATLCPSPTIACSVEVQPLLKQIPGVGRIVNTVEEANNCDAYIPITSLARLTNTTLDNIPPSGYLKPHMQDVYKWAIEIERFAKGRKKVALCWAGRPSHKNDRKRSLHLSQLNPLFERRDDVAFFSVQMGEAANQITEYYGSSPVINLAPQIKSFEDTLAILSCVDQVITVDTSIAHLAGAADIPTMLMLPHSPDWRWLLSRNDSPWYKNMRLYRQSRPCDWLDVLRSVAYDL